MVQTRIINSFDVTDILLANGDDLNLILAKFARPRPLYFFFSHQQAF